MNVQSIGIYSLYHTKQTTFKATVPKKLLGGVAVAAIGVAAGEHSALSNTKGLSEDNIPESKKLSPQMLRFVNRYPNVYSKKGNNHLFEEHLRLLKFGYKNKDLLGETEHINDSVIDSLIINENVVNTLSLIGVNNLKAAFPLKYDGFEKFCRYMDILYNTCSQDEREEIKKKFIPETTIQYKKMATEENLLKQRRAFFNKNKDLNTDNINKLDIQIYNLQNKMKNYIAENKVKMSPQEIIKKIYAIANIEVNYYKNHGTAYPNIMQFINLIQDSSPENDKAWNIKLNREAFKVIRIKDYKDVSQKLDLINCEHLSDLFASLFEDEFRVGFKNLVRTLYENPTQDIKGTIDYFVPENLKTRAQFMLYDIDYDKWTKPDKEFVEHVPVKDIPKTESVDIRQVDMYDIKYALCLGNHAQCCTSLDGGICRWTIAPYITNKACEAIEVLDNGKPVGNSMIFISLIDGKPALIIDNVSLKTKYKNNNQIREGIVKFAHRLAKEICPEGMPVYAGTKSQKVKFEEKYPKVEKNLMLLGETEEDVYVDFSSTHHRSFPFYISEILYDLN